MSRSLDDAVATAASDAPRVASELAAFARAVAGSSRLAKVLANPNTDVDAKRSLINDLTGNALHAVALDLIAEQKTSSAAAFASALTDVAAEFTFAVAERDGRLQAVETGLYEFANLINDNPALRDALVNPAVADEAKEALASDLLKDKADASVLDLVRVLIALDHGRDVDEGAQELSRMAAARRNLLVAEVETAIAMDDAQRERLTAAISQAVGKPVESRFLINPAILGSVVVRVGDEVFDGSVRHRLDQARLAMTGAMAGVN